MSETRDAIIQLGDLFLRKKGYNAFSYADISKNLGIKNAAIHYHFPTKPDLVVSIVEDHIERFEIFKREIQEKKVKDKITAFLNIYEKIQTEQKVCLVGALATDWDTIDENSKKKLQEMAAGIIQWLTSVLSEGLKSKELSFQEPPKTKALLIITNMLAATQLARITGAKDFNLIRTTVFNSLKP